MRHVRARLFGLILLLAGLALLPVSAQCGYDMAPSGVSDGRAALGGIVFAAGVLLTFFLAPGATVIGSSSNVTGIERIVAQVALAGCAIATPILQITGELLRGRFDGVADIIWIVMRAIFAAAFWFGILVSVMSGRLERADERLKP